MHGSVAHILILSGRKKKIGREKHAWMKRLIEVIEFVSLEVLKNYQKHDQNYYHQTCVYFYILLHSLINFKMSFLFFFFFKKFNRYFLSKGELFAGGLVRVNCSETTTSRFKSKHTKMHLLTASEEGLCFNTVFN